VLVGRHALRPRAPVRPGHPDVDPRS
jgi:hypothetical protein